MIDELITVIRILEDEWMTINEALIKLQKQGFNLKEDKAVFILKDGALEIYFDEDENTLKTEIHDRKVFVSNSLNEMNMMGVLLSGVKKEDEWMAIIREIKNEVVAEIIEALVEDTGETDAYELIKFCRDYGDEDIVIIKDADEYIIGT